MENIEIRLRKDGRYLVSLDAGSVEEVRRGLDALRNEHDREHILAHAAKCFAPD
jgi:hypothetical protein